MSVLKIVQINTFSYKAAGNIMMNIHQLVTEAGHDSYVVWSRGRKSENPNEIVMDDKLGVKLHGVYTRLTDKTGFASKSVTKKLLKRLDEIKPDIIHLHNVHGYYINLPLLFSYIKENSIKVVWTLHDCWSFTGHCAFFDMCRCEKWKSGCNHCGQLKSYPASLGVDSSSWNWKKKEEMFRGMDATLVTPCNWLKELVEQSFLGSYPIKTIYNGIDRNVFNPTVDDFVMKKYGLDERPIVLGVASEWTERKGLKDIIQVAKEMPEYQFVVIGLTEKQKKEMPDSVKGTVRTENAHELAALYSAASIFYNPTYEDNFPTTNIEALACGTPILTYDTGGSPEAVISPDIGYIIKKETPSSVNIETVKRLITEMMKEFYLYKANKKFSATAEANTTLDMNSYVSSLCRKASERFDKDQRLREYITLYESIMD